MTNNVKVEQQFDFSKETSLIAYLDLANMFHWHNTLKWDFSVYHVIGQLLELKSVKEVRIYYGLNERKIEKSENFHRRLRETGAIIISKPVKWIKKEITKDLFVKPSTLGLFDDNAHSKLDDLIEYLQKQGKLAHVFIPNPKKYSALLRKFRKYFPIQWLKDHCKNSREEQGREEWLEYEIREDERSCEKNQEKVVSDPGTMHASRIAHLSYHN